MSEETNSNQTQNLNNNVNNCKPASIIRVASLNNSQSIHDNQASFQNDYRVIQNRINFKIPEFNMQTSKSNPPNYGNKNDVIPSMLKQPSSNILSYQERQRFSNNNSPLIISNTSQNMSVLQMTNPANNSHVNTNPVILSDSLNLFRSHNDNQVSLQNTNQLMQNRISYKIPEFNMQTPNALNCINKNAVIPSKNVVMLKQPSSTILINPDIQRFSNNNSPFANQMPILHNSIQNMSVLPMSNTTNIPHENQSAVKPSCESLSNTKQKVPRNYQYKTSKVGQHIIRNANKRSNTQNPNKRSNTLNANKRTNTPKKRSVVRSYNKPKTPVKVPSINVEIDLTKPKMPLGEVEYLKGMARVLYGDNLDFSELTDDSVSDIDEGDESLAIISDNNSEVLDWFISNELDKSYLLNFTDKKDINEVLNSVLSSSVIVTEKVREISSLRQSKVVTDRDLQFVMERDYKLFLPTTEPIRDPQEGVIDQNIHNNFVKSIFQVTQ